MSVRHKLFNSVITATHTIMQTTPHGSPGTLSDDKRLGELVMCQEMWGGKNLRLSTDNTLISKMVQDRHMVYMEGEAEVLCAVPNGDIADDRE